MSNKSKGRKDSFKVFEKAEYVHHPLKWHERIRLFFCQENVAIDGDFICRFKVLSGKHYILSCGKESL